MDKDRHCIHTAALRTIGVDRGAFDVTKQVNQKQLDRDRRLLLELKKKKSTFYFC